MVEVEQYGLKIYSEGDAAPVGAAWVGSPSTFFNPFVTSAGSFSEAVKQFRAYAKRNRVIKDQAIRRLKGRDLACDCASCPDHAKILMELANG